MCLRQMMFGIINIQSEELIYKLSLYGGNVRWRRKFSLDVMNLLTKMGNGKESILAIKLLIHSKLDKVQLSFRLAVFGKWLLKNIWLYLFLIDLTQKLNTPMPYLSMRKITKSSDKLISHLKESIDSNTFTITHSVRQLWLEASIS